MDMSMPSLAVASDPSNVTSDAALPEASNLSKHSEAAHALTPPTSEDNNIRIDDDASSDLSELDLDLEDEEEVVPDHYWDDGKVPVFKPTMSQFRDFKKYMDKIDKYGMKSGIVKVIPPQEWRDDQPALDELVKTIKIKNPISQEFMGTHGIYTQANIEKQRSYNLPEWKALTEETQYQPPARRGERRRNQGQVTRGAAAKTRTSARASAPKDAGTKRKPGRPRKNPLPKEADDDQEYNARASQVPPTPTSPVLKSTEPSEQTTPSKPKPKPRGRQPKGGQQKSVSSRRMNNTTETNDVYDEAAFKDFDYHMDDLDEFTPERCAELETAYWKSLTFAQPMYAADMPGSLFKDECDIWNVAKLPNLLDVLGTKVPGVNTAYLYMGMWKATFAWHLEDVDLYSINYIHFGAPKQWYSISQEDARKFEKAMKSIWPNDSKACDQFLRHKTYLISPEILQKQFGIKVNKLVHYEGEFVITYPYGYHSGYNVGYNCAESVNFATESWLDYGRIAKKCECEADSVWVDVGEIERKLRGEPTPEYYEETDEDDEDDMDLDVANDLPSPPASVAGKPQSQARKRKRDSKEKDAGKKKKKRIRILIKAPHREPCVLCPNDPPNEPLLPTDNGQQAHRCCALYTPETFINSEDGSEKIFGVAGIDKARLDLKCNFCRSKRGACFQCSAKKCTRAYHATCALPAGVQVDVGPVPTFGEDGTEYFEEGFDLRCRFHRPKRAKHLDIDGLEGNKLINNFARSLKRGDAIQAQLLGGDIFAGVVEENRSGEATVLINILPSGDQVEIEWKWIVVLDPIDSLRPKPSAKALPMPEGMSKQSVSIENRQDGVPILDSTFHEDATYKWAEFRNLQIPPQGYSTASIKNPNQVKIDLNKADQLYYYLPKKSTEAKGRFTDDPKGQNHVFKGDFMERVKPARSFRPVAPSYAGGYTGGYTMPQVSRPIPVQTHNSERPYIYKPKTPAYPVGGYNIDQRALASQQQFMQQADPRRASYTTGQYPQPIPPLRQQHSDPTRSSPTPLRPFSEGYYSSRTLPAAIPGEYSQFHQRVRRTSGGSPPPQSYQTQPYDTTPQLPQPSAGSPQTSAGYPQAQGAGRALLGSYGNQMNDSVYKSGPAAQPAMQARRDSAGNGPTAQSPTTSAARPPNNQWTPPSQVYHAYDRAAHPQYPPQNAYRPQPTYQTPQEFQQQIGIQARQPDVSNRWGAYDRMLRDAANAQSTLPPLSNPYSMSTTTAGGAPNGFSIPATYPSPKAPTASPLSDTQTPRAPSPGMGYRAQGMMWGAPPQHQQQPLQNGMALNNTLPPLQSMTQGGPFATPASHPPPSQQ
ncbi:hypothetical protein E4T43_02979 [Aureobasidium subglaciale]|nr:hypothetical protein E4T43_02979 [Aureobasidium subglaciale]